MQQELVLLHVVLVQMQQELMLLEFVLDQMEQVHRLPCFPTLKVQLHLD